MIDQIKNITRKHPFWQSVFINFFNEGKIVNIEEFKYVFELLIKNNDIIKKKIDIDFVKSIKEVNPLEIIQDELNSLINDHKKSKFIKSIKTKSYAHLITEEIEKLLIDLIDSDISIDIIKDQLLNKLAIYKDPSELISGIILFKEKNIQWSKRCLIERIEKENLNASFVFSFNDCDVFEIKDYKASQKLGSSSWCISYNESYFKTYGYNAKRFYFIYNFNKAISDNLSLIGLTVSFDGSIVNSHDKKDNHYNLPFAKELTTFFPKLSYRDVLEKTHDKDDKLFVFGVACHYDCLNDLELQSIKNIILNNITELNDFIYKAISSSANNLLRFLIDNFEFSLKYALSNSPIGSMMGFQYSRSSEVYAFKQDFSLLVNLDIINCEKIIDKFEFNSFAIREYYCISLSENNPLLESLLSTRIVFDDSLYSSIVDYAILFQNFNIMEEFYKGTSIKTDSLLLAINQTKTSNDFKFIDLLFDEPSSFDVFKNDDLLHIINNSSYELILYLMSKGLNLSLLDSYEEILNHSDYHQFNKLLMLEIESCNPIDLEKSINSITVCAIKCEHQELVHFIIEKQYLGLNYNFYIDEATNLSNYLIDFSEKHNDSLILKSLLTPHYNLHNMSDRLLIDNESFLIDISKNKSINILTEEFFNLIFEENKEYLLDEISKNTHYSQYKNSNQYLTSIVKNLRSELILDAVKFNDHNKEKLLSGCNYNHCESFLLLFNLDLIPFELYQNKILNALVQKNLTNEFFLLVKKYKIDLNQSNIFNSSAVYHTFYRSKNFFFSSFEYLIKYHKNFCSDELISLYFDHIDFCSKAKDALICSEFSILDFLIEYAGNEIDFILLSSYEKRHLASSIEPYEKFIQTSKDEVKVNKSNVKASSSIINMPASLLPNVTIRPETTNEVTTEVDKNDVFFTSDEKYTLFHRLKSFLLKYI